MSSSENEIEGDLIENTSKTTKTTNSSKRKNELEVGEKEKEEESEEEKEKEVEEEEEYKESKKKKSKKDAKSPKKKTKKKQDDESTDGSESLFELVKQAKVATTTVIKDWTNRYKSDQSEAVKELISFVIQSSGHKEALSKDNDIDEADIRETLQQLVDEGNYKEVGGEYPLATRKKEWKKFKHNFPEFWDKLILACQKELIYDDFLIDRLIVWLTGISSCQARPFRHTATVASLQILSSLITVVKDVRKDLETAQRQLDAKKKKGKEESLSYQVKNLNNNVKKMS